MIDHRTWLERAAVNLYFSLDGTLGTTPLAFADEVERAAHERIQVMVGGAELADMIRAAVGAGLLSGGPRP